MEEECGREEEKDREERQEPRAISKVGNTGAALAQQAPRNRSRPLAPHSVVVSSSMKSLK